MGAVHVGRRVELKEVPKASELLPQLGVQKFIVSCYGLAVVAGTTGTTDEQQATPCDTVRVYSIAQYITTQGTTQSTTQCRTPVT